MYVAPESKVLMALANVAATSTVSEETTGGNAGQPTVLPDI